MNSLHPELVRLLDKYGLSWELFSKKGRLPKHLKYILDLRRDIITELHLSGCPWSKMMEITGFSLGGINRLTKACWNPLSKRNRQESAITLGRKRKGEKRPWLSIRMRNDWKCGKFDFHIGRIRSQEEKDHISILNQNPEVKAKRSESAKLRWKNPREREKLLSFHQSAEQREIRSRLQATRMRDFPNVFIKGRKHTLKVSKCEGKDSITVKSSYEKAAISILEEDLTVVSYIYEKCVRVGSRHILPDFIVNYNDGKVVLIEVKASWVLSLSSDHKISKRLQVSRTYAESQGMDFSIWTEKDALKDALTRK